MAQDSLTTLTRVKDELGIDAGDTASDSYLTTLITEASAACEKYLRRKLKKATVTEYFLFPRYAEAAFLAKYPVTALTTVSFVTDDPNNVGQYLDYAAIPPRQYHVETSAGILHLMAAYSPSIDPDLKAYLKVTYDGGYVLPEDAQRDMPYDIEEAVVSYVRARYYAKSRDPLLKMEMIPDVLTLQYYNPQQNKDFFQSGVWAGLDAYRDLRIPDDTGQRFRAETTVEVL